MVQNYCYVVPNIDCLGLNSPNPDTRIGYREFLHNKEVLREMGTQAFNRLHESQAEVTSLGIEMDPKVLNNVEK
jgi:hypothetical protein